jgi:hypothetical protein
MDDLSSPAKDEPTLVEGIVSEFRAHNDYWVKQGAICSVPCGDLPNGFYLGADKDLFQLCVEIRAISWKMTQLRLKIGQMPQALAESGLAGSVESDGWNMRWNDYQVLFNLAEPLYDSRLAQLAECIPHTLNGLATKAYVIQTEYLTSSDNDTTATKVVKSIFRDIASIMGDRG